LQADFKPSDSEKAYLAGLFDGEGCTNATFASKKYFSTSKQKEKIYLWPRVQLVISNKNRLLLELIKKMVGLGGLYRNKGTKVWDLRITEPNQVLNMVDVLLVHSKLKNEELRLLRDATIFILQHKAGAGWSEKDKDFFNKMFVLPSQKLRPTGEKRGRRLKYEREFAKQP
jgi:intein/homing endonuclease